MVMQLFQSSVLVELIDCDSSKKFVRICNSGFDRENREKSDFGESSMQYSVSRRCPGHFDI